MKLQKKANAMLKKKTVKDFFFSFCFETIQKFWEKNRKKRLENVQNPTLNYGLKFHTPPMITGQSVIVYFQNVTSFQRNLSTALYSC